MSNFGRSHQSETRCLNLAFFYRISCYVHTLCDGKWYVADSSQWWTRCWGKGRACLVTVQEPLYLYVRENHSLHKGNGFMTKQRLVRTVSPTRCRPPMTCPITECSPCSPIEAVFRVSLFMEQSPEIPHSCPIIGRWYISYYSSHSAWDAVRTLQYSDARAMTIAVQVEYRQRLIVKQQSAQYTILMILNHNYYRLNTAVTIFAFAWRFFRQGQTSL